VAVNRYFTLVWRALLLRCPFCGKGKLFRGWFAMHEVCPHCGVTLAREPGFYLGSIYFNYGLTALIVAIAYPLLLFNGVAKSNVLLGGSLAFVILFPLVFFRHARSLWLGFDQFVDPREGEKGTGREPDDAAQ
jgi:uncharacterized protein (DUF983 family)